MRKRLAAKRGMRTGLILLLALTLCAQFGAAPASATDGTPAVSTDGTIDIWRWERVDSQDDLPFRDGSGYRHAVLLMYEWNGGQYMLDADRRTSGSEFQLVRTSLPESVAFNEKSFRTADNISHMELMYKGTDSDNGNAKQYKFIIKRESNGVMYSLHYSTGDDGFVEESGNAAAIDVLTPNTIDDVSVASGQVALFYNVSRDRDALIRIDDDSGNVYATRSWTWNMARFVMYVGYKETLSAIRNDCTISAGQVANYNGYVYIEPGVTVTVEEGGVLSVSGVLYNNGTIINNGGDIVVHKGSSIEQFCLGDSSGGVLCCDGGNLVILSGGVVTSGKSESYTSYNTGCGSGFVLRNGATCTNFGTLVVGSSAYVVSGATIDNRSSGTMFFCYKPKKRYSGSLNTLSQSAAAAADKYESLVSYNSSSGSFSNASLDMLFVGDDVLLQNEGTIYLGLWAKRVQNSTGTIDGAGSGKIYVQSWASSVAAQYKWDTGFPSAWSYMVATA